MAAIGRWRIFCARVVGYQATRTGGAAVSETRVEAARIVWHEHQMDHGCSTLTCATAQLKYHLYLAAIREQHEDAPEGEAGGEQP